ncbi:hypothetical protein C3J98_12990 [Klebsiella pneumoniae subsp. pneumoniae]|nr:hypothetical protein C3J98_12990 [Klebsiella pneumoniae subsp. pneumoniae]
MMSLWDALRMNMMISYQELVRTFPICGCLQQALMTHHNFLRNFPSSGISVNGFRLTMRPLYQENHAELLPFVC